MAQKKSADKSADTDGTADAPAEMASTDFETIKPSLETRLRDRLAVPGIGPGHIAEYGDGNLRVVFAGRGEIPRLSLIVDGDEVIVE